MRSLILFIVLFCIHVLSLTAQGYVQNFSGGSLPAGYENDAYNAATVENGELKIEIKKDSWNGYDVGFSPSLNISANPFVGFKIHTDSDVKVNFLVNVYLFSGTAQSSSSGLERQVNAGTNATELSFNFNKANTLSSVNTSAITSIQIIIQPGYNFEGTVYIDDLTLGDQVTLKPYVLTMPLQKLYINSGQQMLRLLDVFDGTSGTNTVTLAASSSNTTLLPNANIVIGNSGSTNTRFLRFTPAANQYGTANINLTVSAPGTTNRLVSVPVEVVRNIIPEIVQPITVGIGSNLTSSILLTGISDGNTEVTQQLTISASSSNTAIIPNSGFSLDYEQGNTNATLNITPVSGQAGQVIVTLTLKDNGGTAAGGIDTRAINFTVNVFKTYNNKPTLSALSPLDLFAGDVPTSITLSNIGDGDNNKQNLAITATSSNLAVLPNPTVSYTQGSNTALLNLSSVSAGSSVVTVTITDNGGNADNNGNETFSRTFAISSILKPITGWHDPWSTGNVGSGWGYDGTIVNGNELRCSLTKSNNRWAAFAINFDGFIDISNNPYVCFDAKADQTMNILCFLFDKNDNRTCASFDLNLTSGFKTYSLNFANNSGCTNPADLRTIKWIFFHFATDRDNFTGTLNFRNFQVGDQAVCLAGAATCKIDSIGTHYIHRDAGVQKIMLTGIYDGDRGVNPITISNLQSSNTALIPIPQIGAIMDYKAALTYKPAAGQTGSSTISFTLTASGAQAKNVSFVIQVVTPEASPIAINIDPTSKFQKIEGFGAFGPPDILLDQAISDLGLSIVRNEILPEIEPVNENSSPFALDLKSFKTDVLGNSQITTASYALQKSLGVEKWIGTIWSPPAWMKKNLSTICPLNFMTNNVLDSNYLDELSEFIVAYIKAARDQYGITMYAISIQNELQFNEPYNSCVYTPELFAEAVARVGKRLEDENLATLIFGPENLPAQGNYRDYMVAVSNHPIAKNYLDRVAIHNYDPTGTAQGNTTSQNWIDVLAEARKFPTPAGMGTPGTGNGGAGIPVWMTETSGYEHTWDDAMTLASHLNRSLVFGNLSAWVYWTLEAGTSEYGLMNKSNRYNPTTPVYHASKHFYKYIRPDAVRIGLNNSDIDIVGSAFLNKDESYAIVLINSSTSKTKTVKIGGDPQMKSIRAFRSMNGVYSQTLDTLTNNTIFLPANSITTLWGGKTLPIATHYSADNGDGGVSIFPNPTSEFLNVLITKETYSSIEIIDLSGKIVIQKGVWETGLVTVNLQSLSPGLYFVKIKGDEHSVIQRFIKN